MITNQNLKKKLIILSKSSIKKEAVNAIFENQYEIEFIDVPDNQNRESQPLFISQIISGMLP